jgi:ubiquinone/menaquinone biosynthesis C-methylase UbiE
VTGLDLDPALIARARADADRPGNSDQRRPSFVVGDVAALAFPDGSFDLVVSTLPMRHWADPTAGPAEIGRVLRPGAQALV